MAETKPKMMKAVRHYAPKYDVRVEDVPIPTLQSPTDAIVKITHAGLCGSDLHTYRGTEGEDLPVHTMGHEFLGHIVELGSGISPEVLKVGDKVVSPFTTNCGACRACERGFTCRCEESLLFGSPRLEGGQAGWVKVPNAGGTLFKLSGEELEGKGSGMRDTSLLLLADILPTGLFASVQMVHHPKVKGVLEGSAWPPNSGKRIRREEVTFGVVGLGPVGVCALVSLVDELERYEEVDWKIVAVDLNESRRAKVEYIFRGDKRITVSDSPAPSSCLGVLEVVGNIPALQTAYTIVQPFGVITSVGVHSTKPLTLSGGDFYDKNVSLDFGRCPVRAMFPRAYELLVKRQDVFGSVGGEGSLVERVVKIEQAKEMYEVFDKGQVGKVIFEM